MRSNNRIPGLDLVRPDAGEAWSPAADRYASYPPRRAAAVSCAPRRRDATEPSPPRQCQRAVKRWCGPPMPRAGRAPRRDSRACAERAVEIEGLVGTEDVSNQHGVAHCFAFRGERCPMSAAEAPRGQRRFHRALVDVGGRRGDAGRGGSRAALPPRRGSRHGLTPPAWSRCSRFSCSSFMIAAAVSSIDRRVTSITGQL